MTLQRDRAFEKANTGVAFPVGLNVRNRLAMVSGERAVAQAMILLLMTVPGQRVMRPDYGCRIHDLVFTSGDPSTLGQASFFVQEALQRWEPRVEVLSVDANMDAAQDGRMLVDIQYRVKSSGEVQQLVFPFYQNA